MTIRLGHLGTQSNHIRNKRLRRSLGISNDNFSNLHNNNKRKHEKEREHFPGPIRQYNISEFK